MSLSEKLELLISADPRQGISAIQQFEKQTDKSLSKSEDKFKQFAANVSKVGGAGLGIGGILTALGSAEQAASQQLEAAVGAAGQSFDEFKGRIDSTISTMEGFDHSAVDTQNAIQTLTQAYGDTNQALDQMQLVADLAAAKHESLAEAATQVAKAHGGAARIFKEFGIQVGTNTQGTKDYDGALTVLAQKLSGQAAAASDTFLGHVKALGIQVEDQIAKFGEQWGPAILGVSAIMTAFGPVVSGVSGLLGKLSASHVANTAAAEADATATAEAAAAQGLIVANSSAAVASLYAEDAALTASSAAFGLWGVAVAAGIVVASEAIDIWGSKTEHTFSKVQQYVSESGKDLASSFTELQFEGNQGDPGKFLDALASGGEAGVGALSRLREELRLEGRDTLQVDAAIQRATDSQAEYNKNVDAGALATGNQTKAMQEAQSAADGFQGLLDSISQGMSKQYDSLTANRKAGINYYETLDTMTATLAENKGTLDDHSAAGRKDLTAVLNTGEAIKTLITNRFNETHSVEAATTSGKLYVENLKEQLKHLGFATGDIDNYIAEMHLTPEEIDTTFSNNALSQQLAIQKYVAQLKDIPADQRTAIEAQLNNGQFDQVNQELNALAANRTVNFDIVVRNQGEIVTTNTVTGNQTSEVDIAYRGAGPRAIGGSGLPGQSYFIEPGTHGEVFTPAGNGWFTPTDKLGKGSTSPVQVSITGVVPDDLAEAASRGTKRGLILARRD